MISLKQASTQIDVSHCIVRDAFKRGLYDGLTRPIARGLPDPLDRHGVELPDLPLLHEATWEFVMYEGVGKRRRGPWVPTKPVSIWLRKQIDVRVRVRASENNPDIMTSLARDLETDERRLYAWVRCEYDWIEYPVLEDALWAFGCVPVEDVCDRKLMKISRPRKRGTK